MALEAKIKIFLIVFLTAGACFSIFTIYSLQREIQNSSQQFISQRQASLALDSKIKSLAEFNDRYQKLSPDLEKANALFASAELPVDFIRFLEKTSSDSGVTIKISPSAPAKASRDLWMSSVFHLVSNGPFPNFLRFLEKLENSQYLIEIQDLSIAKLSEAELKSGDELRSSLRLANARVGDEGKPSSLRFVATRVGDVGVSFAIKIFVK
ncbi:MAG: hypothetical protein Q7K28_00090 [Candidatus Wildermuthbacteria bacterium]|nr:hypothetical protein [Candidatus Wildermuthbacteria bacterium]